MCHEKPQGPISVQREVKSSDFIYLPYFSCCVQCLCWFCFRRACLCFLYLTSQHFTLGKHGKEHNGGLAPHIHNESGSLCKTPTHLDEKQEILFCFLNTKQSKHQDLSHEFLGQNVRRIFEVIKSILWYRPKISISNTIPLCSATEVSKHNLSKHFNPWWEIWSWAVNKNHIWLFKIVYLFKSG